jgi:hypothetical protein
MMQMGTRKAAAKNGNGKIPLPLPLPPPLPHRLHPKTTKKERGQRFLMMRMGWVGVGCA